LATKWHNYAQGFGPGNEIKEAFVFYHRFFGNMFFLVTLVIVLMILALSMGRFSVNWEKIIAELLSDSQERVSTDYMVLWLRLPRILMALFVGAALASSGMVYQCLFRNPLVSPDILGISSGACLGVAIAIIASIQNPFFIQILAFVFGTSAVVLSYCMAAISRGHSVIMLVMAGIVVSSFYGALLSLLKYLADPYQQLPSIVFWIMGSLSQAGWQELGYVLPFITVGLIVLFLFRSTLNVISLGDEEAQSLGINVARTRAILICLSTMVVGATISVTGIIGWVGLVVPHISRILVGANHQKSLPHTMFLGAAFVLIMDTIARTLTTQEIPLGVITALIGAPFFAYLLLWKQEKGWGKW